MAIGQTLGKKSALGVVVPPRTGAEQMDIEEVTGSPEPRTLRKAKTARATGKSSQAGYERLTVYVPKAIKQNLERSLVGTGQDMSDVVGDLLTKHLGA